MHVQILCVIIILSAVDCFPRFAMDSNSKTDLVSLEFDIHQNIRQKRDITHPDTVSVLIKTSYDVIPLHLRRIRRDSPQPKIFAPSENGIVEEKISISKENKSMYHDPDNGAAMTIHWGQGNATTMHGSFLHNEKMHFIEPHQREVSILSSSPPIHRMTTSDVLIDYFRDAIVIGGEEMTSERLQEPIRNQNGYAPKTDLYVEYVIVADYKNYLNWADMADTSIPQGEKDVYTKQRMVEFYQHIVAGIDIIFKTANSDRYNINIVFAGIVIFNHTRTPPWTDHYATCPGCDTVDDYLVLKSFSEWAWMYLQKIIRHDHAALFTGFDLYYTAQESAKTIGLSYLSKMCGNYSVSVIEEKRNALSVHVASHELGHNFGARHDGKMGAESCSADDKYLMASKMSRVDNPVMAGNPWRFSSCSRASIHGYIDNLTRLNKNCLLDFPKVAEIPQEQHPGQSYTVDEQCQAMYGKKSFVCRFYHHQDWSAICYGLACWSPMNSECQLIYPHDGTPCSNERWCQQGFCVKDERAGTLDESCPFGNDPVYNCSVQDCIQGSFTQPLCCQFCKQYFTSTPTSVTHSIKSTTAISRDSQVRTGTTHEDTNTPGLTSICPCANNDQSSTTTSASAEKSSTASSAPQYEGSTKLTTETTKSEQQEMTSTLITRDISTTSISDKKSTSTTLKQGSTTNIHSTSETQRSPSTVLPTIRTTEQFNSMSTNIRTSPWLQTKTSVYTSTLSAVSSLSSSKTPEFTSTDIKTTDVPYDHNTTEKTVKVFLLEDQAKIAVFISLLIIL